MGQFIYDLAENRIKVTPFHQPKKWLRKQLLEEKLLNPFGIFIATGAALFIAIVVGYMGLLAGVLLLLAIIGVPFIVACLFNGKIGIIILLVYAFFAATMGRLASFPYGTIPDAMVVLMMFGIFIQQIGKKDWSFLDNPISKIIAVWIVYNLLEVLNPAAASRVAWMYAFRSIAGILLLYYISLYAVNTLRFVKVYFTILILLSLFGALYGIAQEYNGLLDFEVDSVMSDPQMYELLFQGGRLRKFSIFSDPVVFGVLMSFMATFCMILAFGPFGKIKKVGLALVAFICLFSMSFSGTRTAYVLIPIGFVFYVLLSNHVHLILLLGVMFVLGALMIAMPSSNPTIVRVQSAFRPNTDASYQLRLQNQSRIKPYLQSHPMGGGIGSVGFFGKKFTPGTFLANFPPDSGYVKVAVEQGYIGLIIYFLLLFMILKEGIVNYFRCKDGKIKIIYAAITSTFYMLCVASYTQEIFNMYPIVVIFCVSAAILSKLKDFDPYVAARVNMQ